MIENLTKISNVWRKLKAKPRNANINCRRNNNVCCTSLFLTIILVK